MESPDISLAKAAIRDCFLSLGNVFEYPVALDAIKDTIQKNPSGKTALYGCGALSAKLVETYAETLKQAKVCFVTSTASGPAKFLGFPLHAPKYIKDNRPDMVILLSLRYEKEMRRELAGLPVEVKGIKQILEETGKTDDGVWEEDCNTRLKKKYRDIIDELATDAQTHPTMLITSQSFCHHNVRLMQHLSKHYEIIVLVNSEHLNGTIPLSDYADKGYFNKLIIKGSWHEYLETLWVLVRFVPFKLVHFFSMAGNPLPGAMAVLYSQAPVFIEFCDVKEIMFSRAEDFGSILNLDKEQLAVEEQFNRLLLNRSAGIIIKDDPSIIETLSARHGCRPDWIYFSAYPSLPGMPAKTNTRKISRSARPFHIVYIGSLHNDPSYHCYPIHRSIFTTAQILTEQGFHFSVFNGMDATGDGYEDYLAMDEANPLFHYHFAVPENQLCHAISGYDLAWFVHDYTLAKESPYFINTTFPSRLFYYLEAGLPVIVSKTQTFVRSFIENEGIGVAIDFNEMHQLADILSGLDFAELQNRIRQAQEKYDMTRQLPRLIDFYKRKIAGIDHGII